MNNEQLMLTFREEALELLESLEARLLELEQYPDDSELLSSVFRVMHTIKGSSAMFGLNHISEFCHQIESFLSELREGKIVITREFIDYTLRSRDFLLDMLNEKNSKGPQRSSEDRRFLADFDLYVRNNRREIPSKQTENLFRITFKPNHDIFLSGTNPLLLIKELRGMGECSCIPFLSEIPPLGDLNPEHCYTSWKILCKTTAAKNDIEDVFIFVTDKAEIRIELIDSFSEASPEEPNFIKPVRRKQLSAPDSDSIRVKSKKLDDLMDLVGEMVTIHARILQTSRTIENKELSSVIESFGRLTEDLRDNTMSIRMLPLSLTFSRYNRLVRDMAGDLQKKINLVVSGGETELDKSIIEKLYDPLVHIIRNSIDHGIESPDERLRRGKSESGTIRIAASQSGTSVQITIEDDGKGLNPTVIKNKAVKAGIFPEDGQPGDEEIFSTIFHPGFSTAETVTSISGRGVGMDVVKRQIQMLNGSFKVESEEGKYFRIILSIPLTLAIIEGLLVRVGEEFFIVPLGDVEVCVEYRKDQEIGDGKKAYITRQNKFIPFINLREKFAISGERSDIEQIIIVNSRETMVGLLVDQVIGGNQTVIKSLGRLYHDLQGISSATILGDGSVALVLDVEGIVDFSEKEERLLPHE